jgi:WD40 repeat protein
MSHGHGLLGDLIKLSRTIRVAAALCVFFASFAPASVSAQGRRRLPAPLCAIVVGQVICYDQNVEAQPVTPPGQRVLDFAIAPDDNWIAYRTDDVVTLAPIYGSAAAQQQIDTQATPSATLDLTMTTLAWSPDGLTIAYVVANGFRIAIPTESGMPQLTTVEDRLATNLRFSPNGTRLAVQADDGTWSLYTVDPLANTPGSKPIQRTGTIDQAADVAWQDENLLAVALVAGGLYQIDAANPSARPAWTVPSEHFIKLITTTTREVLALHPDPRDTIGNVVSIGKDGKVTPVGASKIDSQSEWGLGGETLVYITSGTPILIDPATGRENTLPLRGVTRLAWTRPLPPAVGTLVMDADLYFLQPDASGVRQVWRLPRSGLDRLTQLTTQTSEVRDYAISPNRAQIALSSLSSPQATPKTSACWRGSTAPTAPRQTGIRAATNWSTPTGTACIWLPPTATRFRSRSRRRAVSSARRHSINTHSSAPMVDSCWSSGTSQETTALSPRISSISPQIR